MWADVQADTFVYNMYYIKSKSKGFKFPNNWRPRETGRERERDEHEWLASDLSLYGAFSEGR